MEGTTKIEPKRERDIYYFRRRYQNRVFERLVSFISDETNRRHLTKKDVAAILKKDPAQITRWLASPSNLTLETISDLLLALDAEAEPPEIVKFADRKKPNYAHPVVAKVIGAQALQPSKPASQTDFISKFSEAKTQPNSETQNETEFATTP